MVQRGELEGKTGNVICKTKYVKNTKIQIKSILSVSLRHASEWCNNFNGFHPIVLWHINTAIFITVIHKKELKLSPKMLHVTFFDNIIKNVILCLTVILIFINMWRNEFSFVFRLMCPITFISTYNFTTFIGLGICQNKYCKIFAKWYIPPI